MAVSQAFLDYSLASSLGAATGAGELLSRYRDSPRQLFGRWAFYLYIAGNAGAAALALLVVHALKVNVGGNATQAVAAGVGAMVILRSAFVTVRIGDRDLPAGFGLFAISILAAVDRVIDRNQATNRSAIVAKIMDGVVFAKAFEALPAHCLLLMANATPEEVALLSDSVAGISAAKYTDQTKSFNLGVVLIKFAGEAVLRGAVSTLGNQIRQE